MNEAELLLTESLNCDCAALYLNRKQKITDSQGKLLSLALQRRILREPLAYILEKINFYGLDFKVTPDVLIPRQETEILVEKAIGYAWGENLNILEIGTGSGCIAVSLAKNLSAVKITATDISQAALELARKNAEFNNLEEKINFIQTDLFPATSSQLSAFDLIISNPPYIRTGDLAGLQPEVKFEPAIALDGGADGLEFYRKIISLAPQYLNHGGFLIFELGFDQAREVENIFQKNGKFEIIEVIKDYSGIERVIIAKKV